jgi:hypothetical protein
MRCKQGTSQTPQHWAKRRLEWLGVKGSQVQILSARHASGEGLLSLALFVVRDLRRRSVYCSQCGKGIDRGDVLVSAGNIAGQSLSWREG